MVICIITHHRRLHRTFMIMHPLVQYYLCQTCHGSSRGDNGIGPIYITSTFLKRGQGFRSFMGGL